MGLFVSEDRNYDESVRQVGFNRYKQLLSAHFGDWFKVNLLTILGALPLAAGIVFSILSSSVLVLIPSALVGGMIFGPFLAGMYDAVLRGMRDDPHHWWENYRRSWKQNFRSSLLPGAILGLFLGMYAFMGMLFWWAETPPTAGTIVLSVPTVVAHVAEVRREPAADCRNRNCRIDSATVGAAGGRLV